MSSSQRSIKLWSDQKNSFNGKPNSSGGGQCRELADLIHAVEAASVYEVCHFTGTETVLDVGAGGGRWSKEFADKVHHITAIEPSDIFEILTKNVAEVANVSCQRINFEDFPEDRQFDVVVVSGVLMYLIQEKEVTGFLAKVSRLLRPGGRLLMREPVASRDRTVFNWRIHRATSIHNFDDCKYWERVRPEKFYIGSCRNHDLHLVRSFPSHAPFFRSLPPRLKVIRPLVDPLAKKVFHLNNFKMVFTYNRCFRRTYSIIQDVFSSRAFRLYIFRKGQ